jgi:predicted GIY-YIG superfamily endonuclease
LRQGFTNTETKRFGALPADTIFTKLVYYEAGDDASGAIAREKQIKAGSRQKKIDLINEMNPEWRDLYSEL